MKPSIPRALTTAALLPLLCLQSFAADPPASAARPAKVAGSLSGPAPPDCAALRKRYAESQACFSPYRLANGGIKPEAFKRCHEMPDPALTCGPAIVSPN